MDSGELDFYQHSKVCSNTCRSTKIDLVGTKVSVSCDPPADLLSASASSADCEFLGPNRQLVCEPIRQCVVGAAGHILDSLAELMQFFTHGWNQIPPR